MNKRRAINFDTWGSSATVVDTFPGQLVCAKIHKLGVIQTTQHVVHVMNGLTESPPYPFNQNGAK